MKNLTWIGELSDITIMLGRLIEHPVTPSVTPPENIAVLKAAKRAIDAVGLTSCSRDRRRQVAR